jgi:hypothetical protein
MRTGLHLDRDVAQVAQAAQPALAGGGRQRLIRYQRYHGCPMAGADLPQMQIGYAASLGLQPVADDRFQISVRIDVEQHGAGSADQPDGPIGDDKAADDSDGRIGPDPVRIHRNHQRRDGQNGCCGIGHDVDIGRTKVVVMVVMPVGVMIAVVMAMIVAQQPRADEIGAEAEHRDRDGLALGDGHRMSEAGHAFVGDLNGDHGQDDRAGKGGEITEFAGAERETRIARLPSRKQR